MGKLSDEIKRLRGDLGMSVRQLAKALDKSPGYVSRIEARGEIPTPELLMQIAEKLGGSFEVLLEKAMSDELNDAKDGIEERYQSALTLFRKSRNDD